MKNSENILEKLPKIFQITNYRQFYRFIEYVADDSFIVIQSEKKRKKKSFLRLFLGISSLERLKGESQH